MAQDPAPAPSYRFGLFEVRGRTGELLKQGRLLRLRGRPFDILLFLLERRGDVITREELKSRLWSTDTFVDFDHGLNTAVNRLRDALGDSAENPRFIETLPKRGYRFIAPIEVVLAASATPIPTAPSLDPEPAPVRTARVPFRRMVVAAVTLAAALGVAGVLYVRQGPASRPAGLSGPASAAAQRPWGLPRRPRRRRASSRRTRARRARQAPRAVHHRRR